MSVKKTPQDFRSEEGLQKEAPQNRPEGKGLVQGEAGAVATLSQPAAPENYLRKKFKEIIDAGDFGHAVRSLSPPDYFYLLKTVDPEDALMLLEAGGVEQWEHLLDLEIWERDRLDLSHIDHWFKLMQRADSRKLAHWLVSEGADLALYYFSRVLDIRYQGDEEDPEELSKDYFTLDGTFYFRVKEGQDPQTVREIMMNMAAENFEAYRGILMETGGVLPSEQEEQLYRHRNLRLAEFGFFPLEEALEIYSPLDPSILQGTAGVGLLPLIFDDEEDWDRISHFPLAHLEMENLFLEVIKDSADPSLQERCYREFAGLANQVYSARPSSRFDPEMMVQVCQEAARLIALALDHTVGSSRSDAERLLRAHPLNVFFRVGYGLILKVKSRAVTWTRESWFKRQGLPFSFWGDEWANLLKGLHFSRPKYYDRQAPEAPFRDFQKTAELKESEEVINRLSALDDLFEALSAETPLSETLLSHPETDCRRLLFHYWSSTLIERKPSFEFPDLEVKKKFINKYNEFLIHPLDGHVSFLETFREKWAGWKSFTTPNLLLEETLSWIWDEFREEFLLELEQDFSKGFPVEGKS